jgi:putative membrane protein
MIKRYSDHAANERTFLAWVRTAIAVMAFGFIVEKFDLFLEVAAPSSAAHCRCPGTDSAT